MFTLPVLLLILRLMNKYLDGERFIITQNPNSRNGNIENYFPFVFHTIIIILIIISFFNPDILTDNSVHALVSDGIFQFVSTSLILIISMINPFVSFSKEAKLRLIALTDEPKFSSMKWLLMGKNWQLIKALTCILIVAYFIYKGILVIPSLNQGVISGITLTLIAFFLAGNIIQLIQNPVLFKKKTLFRLSMLYRSFKLSILICLGLVVIIFLFSVVTRIDIPKIVKAEAVLLLVYNVVMCYNEFKILKSLI